MHLRNLADRFPRQVGKNNLVKCNEIFTFIHLFEEKRGNDRYAIRSYLGCMLGLEMKKGNELKRDIDMAIVK